MADFVSEKGTYEIVLGRGRVSLSELAALERGSVVTVSDRQAGDPVDLDFNCRLIAHGQVERIEDLLIFRVAFNDWSPAALPRLFLREDVTEPLPCAIRLCSVEGTLADLKGVGEYGLINFGRKMATRQPAELVVAGRVAATGIAAIGAGKWALAVGEVTADFGEPNEVYTTGALPRLDTGVKGVYDFARPDMVSREQIQELANLHHKLFAQNLQALGMSTDVYRIDQMQLGEALGELDGGVLYRVSERASAGSPTDEKPAYRQRYFTQLSGAEAAVDAQTADRLSEQSSGIDRAHPLGNALLFVSDGDAGYGDGDGGQPAPEALLGAFRNSWRSRTRVPALELRECDRETIAGDALEANRMAVIAEMRPPTNEPQITVIYPALELLKLLRSPE